MTLTCTMIRGDCLEVMPTLPKASVNMVVADLPYGVSGCKWDIPVDMKTFWAVLHTTCNTSRVVLSATQPIASQFILSWPKGFRHDLIWARKRPSGFFRARSTPLRAHEHLLIFGEGTTYNPIMTNGKKYISTGKINQGQFFGGQPFVMDRQLSSHDTTKRFPISILSVDESDIRTDNLNGHRATRTHPTQKPVALLDWLIRTYSNPGDMVLDPVSGSATTAVSALQNGRHVTCIEKDPTYFEAGVERVRKHIADNQIDAKVEVRT